MKSRYLAITIALCAITSCFSQKGKINDANKDYEKMAYLKASEIYLKVAENGYKSEELFKNLADSFYFNANYIEAAKWYSELFDLAKIEDPVYLLRYSQSLRVSGSIQKANEVYADYAKIAKINPDFNSNSKANNAYEIEPLDISTAGLDFGGFVKDDILYFASNGRNEIGKEKADWDGQPFLNLYEVKTEKGKPSGEVIKIGGKLNSRYHDVSACITKDGQTMYFTRNNTSHTKSVNGFKTEYLKIYSAKLVDGKWTDIKELSINGSNFSTAHPALNENEDRLYFVSDRPGSIGQTDIFYASINNGIFGDVVNVGKDINTVGRESFPFVNKDKLYFSSDGHIGLGGYDVFYTSVKDFATVTNVGKPVNSVNDDFAFYFNNEMGIGFISSNREGGQGGDDIYAFKEVTYKFYGVLTDAETKGPIGNATVFLLDASNNVIATTQTDGNGKYEYVSNMLPAFVKAEKSGYGTDQIAVLGKEYKKDFVLRKNVIELKNGNDLAKGLNIKEIYFDFGKSDIRPDAEVELQKVLAVLEKFPSMKIDVRAHSDSQGPDKYNMLLSNKRAKSTINYFVTKGISHRRISGKGYGETQLLNDCKNGVECSDQDHQLNRRCEFIITSTGELIK